MSKSTAVERPGHAVLLLDGPDAVRKTIMSAVTDSARETRFEHASPGVRNLLTVWQALDGRPMARSRRRSTAGGTAALKKATVEAVVEALADPGALPGADGRPGRARRAARARGGSRARDRGSHARAGEGGARGRRLSESVLFLFLDGVGLGLPDPAINPFARAHAPALAGLAGGPWHEGLGGAAGGDDHRRATSIPPWGHVCCRSRPPGRPRC
jgi:hypothetical protein